ncbi:hypothetical protein GF356_00345, partial [candidate division GN15 bacterium]|nr:hypothetical protein [candidate division GN15 bacterium]
MIRLSPKTALILFIVLVAFVIAQATWWVVFMAQLVDEKVELAEQLTSDPVVIERIHEEEIDRQVMIGLEGLVFLLVLGGGLWIIYYAYTRQQELNRRQENFLMATTHELKTPLSSIRVYLDALQSDRVPEGRKAEVIPRIREDVQRLQNLVDKTLQAGRIGRQSLSKERRETFDFSGLVQERLNALLELPNSKRLELTRDITPSLMVSGERASLATAIDQVLENALKYTRQETIKVHVKVE